MPDIIIAGPNGAGKTTFANELLPEARKHFAYINADEIAREDGFRKLPGPARDVAAGREMLGRINAATAAKLSIMFETTLASLGYAQKIRPWQKAGYSVQLYYLQLGNVDVSVQRVARRVAMGGHSIPEETIRRRFAKSLVYLELHYKPVVDAWYVWESLEGRFELRETWNDR